MTSSDRTTSYIIKAVRAGAKGDKILATYADGTEVMVVKSGGAKYDRLAVYGCEEAVEIGEDWYSKKGYYFCRLGPGRDVKLADEAFTYKYPKPGRFAGYPLVKLVTIEDAAK